MRTGRCFQPNAFQRSAFQMPDLVSGSGWGWYEFLRAREAYLRRKKRAREEDRAPEPVLYAPIRTRLSIVARPIVTDLSALAARLSPRDDRDELAEFRAFMDLVASMAENGAA